MTGSPTIVQPTLGPVGWLRWAWRNLTSMRTALLLLLLAVAALPGSIWPQRSINPTRTAEYIDRHPSLGPVLDRLGFFEVYATPWFSAIYLLLLISLIGCVLPRTRIHLRHLRGRPPRCRPISIGCRPMWSGRWTWRRTRRWRRGTYGPGPALSRRCARRSDARGRERLWQGERQPALSYG